MPSPGWAIDDRRSIDFRSVASDVLSSSSSHDGLFAAFWWVAADSACQANRLSFTCLPYYIDCQVAVWELESDNPLGVTFGFATGAGVNAGRALLPRITRDLTARTCQATMRRRCNKISHVICSSATADDCVSLFVYAHKYAKDSLTFRICYSSQFGKTNKRVCWQRRSERLRTGKCGIGRSMDSKTVNGIGIKVYLRQLLCGLEDILSRRQMITFVSTQLNG